MIGRRGLRLALLALAALLRPGDLAGAPAGPTGTLPAWIEAASGIELVRLPAGAFVRGSPADEPGREAQEVPHRVAIPRPFFLGRTEVTQEQWRRIAGTRPSAFPDCPRCPVESVDVHEVAEFLARLRAKSGRPFRLPTEAEWEYACRAGTTTAYSTGATLGAAQANVDDAPDGEPPSERDRRRPLPVASFAPNPWGLYDLHGNVWEWTADPHCPYPNSPAISPATDPATDPGSDLRDPRPDCASELRVIRGGSWLFGADSARCALRYTHRPGDSGPSLGFRVALDAPAEDAPR